MLNVVIRTRFPAHFPVLAALLLGELALFAADSDTKMLALSSLPPRARAANSHTAAQRSAPKQTAETAAPGSGRQTLRAEASWCQINGDRVNVRTGPGTQYQILAALHGGDYVKARAMQDGWLEVDWPQNVPAWIGKEFVQTSTDAAGSSSAVTKRTARVYSAGHLSSTVVAKLDSGARVVILGQEGNWYRVKAPESAAAYVSARYALSGVVPPQQPSNTAAPAATQTPAPAPSLAARSTKAPAPTPAVPSSSASAPAPDGIQSAPPNSPRPSNEDLLRAIEQTRRDLQASPPAKPLPIATETRPAETARASANPRKEADELETALIAIEDKIKAQAEDQARRETEAKRLQEIEAARIADETRRRVEAEEQAKREAAAKRLQEIEAARIADETRSRVEAEEQAKREAEAERLKAEEASRVAALAGARDSAPRDGAFFDPLQAVPTVEAAQAAPVPQPPAAPAPALVLPAPAELPAAQVPMDANDEALLSALPRTLKRVNAKYVVPAQAPVRIQEPAVNEARALVIKAPDEAPQPTSRASARGSFMEPEAVAPERSPQVLRIPAPAQAVEPRLPELPEPAGEPPPSLRLKPFFETQVRGVESSANLVTAEGVIERRTPSPVAGVEYALVQDGRTLHFLTARADVNLEGLVGRRVSVSGVPLPSAASEAPLLEVGTASINE